MWSPNEDWSLAKRTEFALTPRGRTRMDTKVSTLVNPVSFIPNLAQTRDRRPLRNKGTAVELLYRRGAQCAPIPQHIRSSRIPFCYTGGLVSAERGITVPRNPLARCNRQHLRINLLINAILQGTKFLPLQSKTTVKATVVCIEFSNYTLKRNRTTSPSCITYSLPSERTRPFSRAAASEPSSMRSL